ncbi:MAG: peptide ABC transporter substrate-binding protein [Patescibacteria group bacterium]|nr:peptide ABC transporter substrate-binding protein [Patescibacteria group bacterium]
MFQKIFQILHSFSKKERRYFIAAFCTLIISLIGLVGIFIKEKTYLAPEKGGEYTEGIIGQPAFINPVLSFSNNADSDIIQLIFADIKTISDKYEAGSDKKIFDIRIKGDIFWQDGKPIVSDDVIYTIQAIQDPDVNSPLAPNWRGVKAERVSEREVRIYFPSSYAYSENIITGLRPVPKHIFKDISPANLKLSKYNLEPVGSGPFKFSGFEKRRDGYVKNYTLVKNENYFGAKPRLDKFIFNFYQNESDIMDAFNSGNISGFSGLYPADLGKISAPYRLIEMKMPRYYAIFFNPYNNILLKDKNIRTTLNHATDKNKIINDVFNGKAEKISGPVLMGKPANDEFSPNKAREIFENSGWKINEGIFDLNGRKLEFNLTVYPIPVLIETARIIKDSWAEAGIKVNIIQPSASDFSSVLKNRDYEMILSGNIYGKNIDPFSFWHSSQKFYPGLNLSLYDSKYADSLIESARTDLDGRSRQEKFSLLESTILNDRPAVFLYSPAYIYVSNKTLNGFEKKYLPSLSSRFENISEWHINTVRKIK